MKSPVCGDNDHLIEMTLPSKAFVEFWVHSNSPTNCNLRIFGDSLIMQQRQSAFPTAYYQPQLAYKCKMHFDRKTQVLNLQIAEFLDITQKSVGLCQGGS